MKTKKRLINDYFPGNEFFIYSYFRRAISERKLLTDKKNVVEFELEARNIFESLPLYANTEQEISQWCHWIEKYISSERWEHCKSAIRQNKMMRKKGLDYITFRIPRSLSKDIRYYAAKTGLKKFAAMQKAIDAAINSLDLPLLLYANGKKNK